MNKINNNFEIIQELEIFVKYLPLDIQPPILQKLDIFFRFLEISGKCQIPNTQFDLSYLKIIVQLKSVLQQNLMIALDLIPKQNISEAINCILKVLSSVYDYMNYFENERNIQNNCLQQKKHLQNYMDQITDQYVNTSNQLKNEFNLEVQQQNNDKKLNITKIIGIIQELESNKERITSEIDQLSQQPQIFLNNFRQNNDLVVQQTMAVLNLSNRHQQQPPKQFYPQNQQSIQQKTCLRISHIYFYDIKSYSKESELEIKQIKLEIKKISNGVFHYKKPDLSNLIQQITNSLQSLSLSENNCLYNIILNISEEINSKEYDYVTPKLYQLIKFLKDKVISITIIDEKNKNFYSYFVTEMQNHIPSLSIRIFKNFNDKILFPPLPQSQSSIQIQNNQKDINEIKNLQQKIVKDSQTFYQQTLDQENNIQIQTQQQQQQQQEIEQRYQKIEGLCIDLQQINEEIVKQKTLLQSEEEDLQRKESFTFENQCSQLIGNEQLRKQFGHIADKINEINFQANISQYLVCLDEKVAQLEKLEKNLHKILLSINGSCLGLMLKLNKCMNNKLNLELDDSLNQIIRQLVGSQVSRQSLETLKSLKTQTFLEQQYLNEYPYSSEAQEFYKIIRKKVYDYNLQYYFNNIFDSLEQFNNINYSQNLIQRLQQSY